MLLYKYYIPERVVVYKYYIPERGIVKNVTLALVDKSYLFFYTEQQQPVQTLCEKVVFRCVMCPNYSFLFCNKMVPSFSFSTKQTLTQYWDPLINRSRIMMMAIMMKATREVSSVLIVLPSWNKVFIIIDEETLGTTVLEMKLLWRQNKIFLQNCSIVAPECSARSN